MPLSLYDFTFTEEEVILIRDALKTERLNQARHIASYIDDTPPSEGAVRRLEMLSGMIDDLQSRINRGR